MKKIIFIPLLLIAAFTGSCSKKSSKNSSSTNASTPLSFSELKADVNPVKQSNYSRITATATGSNLSYSWSASHGDLFGSGSSIVYSTAPCCVGTHTITCVVSNGSSSQTKTLVMTVTN